MLRYLLGFVGIEKDSVYLKQMFSHDPVFEKNV